MFIFQFGPVAEGVGTLATVVPVEVGTRAVESLAGKKRKKRKKRRARA